MAKKGIILVEPVSNYIDGVPEIKTTDDYDYNVPLGLHAIERLEQHFPYAETPKDLENAGSQLKERDVEFTFSLSFHPDWIEQVCHAGWFPMAIPVADTYIMAAKSSTVRCVMACNENLLRIHKRTRQKAAKYTTSMDKDWAKGENWLCPFLQRSFTYLHENRDKFVSKFHSFEVWDGDTLIAGEIGYAVGSIYTSLSGAYSKEYGGAGNHFWSDYSDVQGSVQLCCTGKILDELGFKWWDFEMSHPYKLDLGAKEVPRDEWAAIYSQCRTDPPIELKEIDKVSAKLVLAGGDYTDKIIRKA